MSDRVPENERDRGTGDADGENRWSAGKVTLVASTLGLIAAIVILIANVLGFAGAVLGPLSTALFGESDSKTSETPHYQSQPADLEHEAHIDFDPSREKELWKPTSEGDIPSGSRADDYDLSYYDDVGRLYGHRPSNQIVEVRGRKQPEPDDCREKLESGGDRSTDLKDLMPGDWICLYTSDDRIVIAELENFPGENKPGIVKLNYTVYK